MVVEPGSGIKINDFTCDMAVVLAGVHGLDRANPALPGEDVLPEVILVVAQGGDDPDSSDYDAAVKHE
jgi:hypothetical protein